MISGVLLAVLGFAGLTPDQALQDAVAHSPEIAVAHARVAEAAANLAGARGTLVPALSGSYAQTPQGNPPGPNIVSRLATIGLQTNVADLVAYEPTVRQNVLLLESARDDASVADRDERIKTVGLYFDALKARAILVARSRAFDLATAQRDAAEKRFSAGDGPRLDVIRAEVSLANATAELESARGNDANATDALALETGIPSSEFALTAEVSGPVDDDDAADPDPAVCVRTALDVRAEIASATAAEHAEIAASRVAAFASFPSLTVGGGYTTGTDSGVEIGAPSINVALTLPLGPGAASRSNVASARLDEARAKVESARRAVIVEVGAAARTVGTLRRAAAASRRAREQAQIELDATELGYRSGASSSLEVRSAQTAFAQAAIDESTALYDVRKARLILALRIGR